MTRTIINLDRADKKWLDAQAERLGRSMTDLVREAVKRLRAEEERKEPSLEALLNQARGVWKAGDGLAFQRKLRKEWRRK